MPQQLIEMMQMSFTTTIKLPTPAKSFAGKTGILSADSKQLVFKRKVDMDVKLTKEDFDFSVEY